MPEAIPEGRVILSRCPDLRSPMQVTPEEGCSVLDASGFHIPPGTLAQHCADLYEAAGLPAPVILDRFEIDGTPAYLGSLVAGVTSDGMVELGYGSAQDKVNPALARQWAACVAAVADLAEARQRDPGPADVRELALHLHRTRCVPNGCCNEEPSSGDLEEALAALRWMQDKQRGGAGNG